MDQKDHYLASIVALNYATHTALLGLPENYRHGLKYRMQNAINSCRSFESEFVKEMLSKDKQLVTIYEELSAFYTEVLQEMLACDDKRGALALLKAFNKGEVEIKEPNESIQ